MTVIRLSTGGLFVQSPAELTPELQRALDASGTSGSSPRRASSTAISTRSSTGRRTPGPNCSPGLDAHRPDLRFDALLGDSPDPRWSADIDQVAIMGNRWLTEIALFHRPSRLVILGGVGSTGANP